ncbi:MAG: sulfoxide reductase heme-binding subunit YedZ [Rhodoferax sp.]|nr:sulfoxide reductase heme-binding subunit YedZ [Rhodoferax sp.]
MAEPSAVGRWRWRRLATKPLIFVLLLCPLAWLIYAAANHLLGANPAQALVRASGDWTLRLLCLVLALTPLRVSFGWPELARLRRMVGLFVFFYATLHALSYGWFDMGLELADMAKDIGKRPFILVGFSSWLLLLALALTSWDRAVQWLGGRNWKRLHRAVYLVAGLSVLHFFWMRSAKNDLAEVALYALILAVLLGWRAWRAWLSAKAA